MRLLQARGPVRAAMRLWALVPLFWLAEVPTATAQDPMALALREEETGSLLWCAPVKAQEEFSLEFLHSYERFPVRENYRVLGPGKILFEGLLTRSMLNGQGFAAEAVHTRSDGWLETASERAAQERVEFIMGARQHADHRILLRGKDYPLSRTIKSGAILLLRVEEGTCAGPLPHKWENFKDGGEQRRSGG